MLAVSEVKTIWRLRHPNIVNIIGVAVFFEQQTMSIHMELFDCTVLDLLSTGSKFL